MSTCGTPAGGRTHTHVHTHVRTHTHTCIQIHAFVSPAALTSLLLQIFPFCMCNSTQSHTLSLSFALVYTLAHAPTVHTFAVVQYSLSHTHTSPVPGYLFIGVRSWFLLAALHDYCIILHAHTLMHTDTRCCMYAWKRSIDTHRWLHHAAKLYVHACTHLPTACISYQSDSERHIVPPTLITDTRTRR